MANCLNCNKPTIENFCSFCGQKTNTHRITFKHFITHDVLHGVWHIEKGILFTLKEALLRPGKAALDYISGKRIRYYNVFYLTLIIIGLLIFINHVQNELSHYYFNTRLNPETDNAGKKIDTFLSSYSKLIIFAFIPLFAINSFIVYSRKKLNLSEHFIIAGMIYLGVIIINLISMLLFFIEYIDPTYLFFDFLNYATPSIILLFIIFNYYKTFSENYSKLQNILRVFLFILLLFIELIILVILIFGYFTNWEFKLKMVY
ncbi:DUF3667 domain-containing protein [Flavobacterium sp.]|uniref:DUF3667 domain-containing protein n=1 Tax=Flavobacterium sp. TaxID=239 RepID=UPI0026368DEA|nr:DUF3667 domain-containing protein [Flavobacterium sp.]